MPKTLKDLRNPNAFASAQGQGSIEETTVSPVIKELHEIALKTAFSTWKYAHNQPIGIFCMFDFTNRQTGILTEVPHYGLQDVRNLSSLSGGYVFETTPEIEAEFERMKQNTMENIETLFHNHKAQLPHCVWSLNDIRSNRKKIAIDYALPHRRILDFESSLKRWQERLVQDGWESFTI